MIENMYFILALISGLFIVVFGVVAGGDEDTYEVQKVPTYTLKAIGWIVVVQSIYYLVV